MAVLHAKDRNALSSSQFAGPDRSFPIPDENHGRAALSMAHYASDPGAIRAAVLRKFPAIDRGDRVRQMLMSKMKSG